MKPRAMIHGGQMHEVFPYPEWEYPTRKWPASKELRPVTIKIVSYKGLSLGAKHWDVTIKEDENPAYDKKENAWRVCWDDKDARGQVFEYHFLEFAAAAEWTKKVVKAMFDPKTHILHPEYEREAAVVADLGIPVYYEGKTRSPDALKKTLEAQRKYREKQRAGD